MISRNRLTNCTGIASKPLPIQNRESICVVQTTVCVVFTKNLRNTKVLFNRHGQLSWCAPTKEQGNGSGVTATCPTHIVPSSVSSVIPGGGCDHLSLLVSNSHTSLKRTLEERKPPNSTRVLGALMATVWCQRGAGDLPDVLTFCQ